MEFLKKTIKLKDSDSESGVFDKSVYPEEYQNKTFYFHEYCQPDGELVEKDDPICKLRVGEKSGYFFNSLTVIASEEGILEWTLKKDNPIYDNYTFYRLHKKGCYQGENDINKKEFKHYFKTKKSKCSLDKWLVENGEKIHVGENVYMFTDSNQVEHYHKAEKEGFIQIISSNSIYSIVDNELLYCISETPPEIVKQENKIIESKEDFCFVYLMHDTSNGFYKIGISNKPHYREKTLQSEKPTIELIVSKKFPVRKIAESIEKSLHQVYSNKRLRGEWFDLDKNDVENIIESLK